MVNPQPTRTVRGQVFRLDGLLLTGGGFTVRAFDAISASNIVPLGNAVSLQTNGNYQINYTWQSTGGRNGPNLLVRVFNPQGQIVGQVEKQFAGTQEILNITVNFPAPPPPTFTLACTVQRQDTNATLPNVRVDATFQLGSQVLLTRSGTTNADGLALLTVERASFANVPAGQPITVRFQAFQDTQSLPTSTTIPTLQLQDQKITIQVTVPIEWVVRGNVLKSDGTPLKDKIAHVNNVKNGNNRLGLSITDSNGFYKVRYTMAPEAGAPDLVVSIYNEQGQQLAVSPRKNNAQPEETIDLTIPVLEPEPTEEIFIVKGHIRQADGMALIGATTQALDKDMRHLQLLGQQLTNKQGYYEITYTRAQFRRAEKSSADLVVKVFDANNNLLIESPVIFNAEPVEIVDLMVGGGEYQGLSEIEQIVTELLPLVENVPFTELIEADITFLVGETGIDAQKIIFLVLASRLSEQTNIPFEAFYGLFRQNLPTNLSALLAQSPEVQRQALETALRNNIIPLRLQSQFEQILQRLRALIAEQAFQTPSQPGTYSFGDLLNTTLSSRAVQQEFLTAYINHTGDIETFWSNLRQQPNFQQPELIENLQLTLKLGSFTRNHLPLVQYFQQQKQLGGFQSLRDLAKLDENGWLQLITTPINGQTIGFPGDMPGNNNTEKASNYANALTRLVEDAFPTPVLAERLKQDTITQIPARTDLIRFFDNNLDLDLSNTYLEDYFAKNTTALTGISDRNAFTDQLKAVQRVFKLTPRYRHVKVLLENGLDSAQRITQLGKTAFINRYGESLGGTNEAKLIYQNASQTSALALTLMTEYGTRFNGPQISALASQSLNRVEGIPDWETLFGSLDFCECEHCRSLYSPAAYFVDSLHWLSDRIQHKKQLNGTASYTVKQVLFQYRPDLGNIELSCENTNTPIPYIDLVNEILENAIDPAPPAAFIPFDLNISFKATLDNRILVDNLRTAFTPSLSSSATIIVIHQGREWRILDTSFAYTIQDITLSDTTLQVTARSLQTYGSAEQLRANPQYVNPRAYERLRTAVYPWHLPFDLWTEETRTYLEHLGVKRHELMRNLLPQNETYQLAIASEYLGLTTAERQIITGDFSLEPDASIEPWEFWGLQESANIIPAPTPSNPTQTQEVEWQVVLENVRRFLNQSRLSYIELLELLQTRLVNPEQIIKIEAIASDPYTDRAVAPTTCDTTKLQLTELSESALNKIHRFVRLWRKLGWSMQELDQAIIALQPSTVEDHELQLNNALIVRLSQVQSLHSQLRLSIEETLTFWSSLDTTTRTGKPSLYERLFQNPTLKPVDPAFQLNEAGTELAIANNTSVNPEDQKISKYQAKILAALKLNSSDLSTLLKSEFDENAVLNLANLSQLYRITILASGLKLSVQDVLTLKALSGINPFDPENTENTLRFVELAHKVRRSGIRFAELDYLLRHQFTERSGITPTEAEIAIVLDDIRSGLQTIARDNQ